MQQLEAAGAWLGRLLLAAIFLHEAWAKLTAYGAAVGYMEAFGLPGWLLPFAIAVELGGGVMVLLGSAAYADGSPTEAVRATVSSLRPNTALEIA